MNIWADDVDAPNVVDLAPYRAGETRRDVFSNVPYDVTTFVLPEDFDVKIVYSYHISRGLLDPSTCRIQFYRPAKPS